MDNLEINDDPPKKTRGRKKKVQPEIEDNSNIDIEQLQIEQVKKKRGRKKK